MENLKNIRFILGVAAGKGGVGKSTLAVNLARAFSRQGLKAGLLDADLYGPSLRQMMPEEAAPSKHPSIPEKIIPAMACGIKTISMAYFWNPEAAAAVRAPYANGVIKQFLHSVEWGVLDILVIDFPPGTGDIHLTIGQESRIHGMVIVTTPQEIALLDVRKAVHMCHQMSIPIVGVLENMSYFSEEATGKRNYLFGCGGGKKLSEETGIPLLGEIPIEPLLAQASDRGENLPNCAALSVIEEASKTIVRHLEALEQMEGQYVSNFELVWQ